MSKQLVAVGCANGYDPKDLRCTAHVDFINTGRTLWAGEDFECTYCGTEWRDGLTPGERYERDHNVWHCNYCFVYVPNGECCGGCNGSSPGTGETFEQIQERRRKETLRERSRAAFTLTFSHSEGR